MNHAGAIRDEHYYIASGAKNKMYVLRYHLHEQWFNNDRSGERNQDYHIRNLSIDWDKALAKAKDYVDSVNANRDNPIDLYGEPVVLDKITQRDKEVIEAEKLAKAEKQAKFDAWFEQRKKWEAEKNNNFVYACWANHMAKECKRFDALQAEPLDTENRITMRGTVKSILEYPDNYSYYNDYIYKAIIELEGGQTVFGSLLSYEAKKVWNGRDGEEVVKWKQRVDIGDNVMFDAKLEKPKDFDGTFYYYKRPTKVKIL